MDIPEEKQLKFAYWFTSNKEKIKKLGLAIFGLIDLILLGYGIWGFASYYLTYNKEEQLFQNWPTINWQSLQRNRPEDLKVLETNVIGGNFGKYDLVAKIKNPNDQWVASQITYRFLLDNNKSTPSQTSFILAEEEKYLMVLAYESPERIKNLTIQFDQVGWQRLTRLKNFKKVEFSINVGELTPLSDLVQSKTNLQRLSFTVKNNSIYNLWEVGFQIALLGSQNKTVGINYLIINDFPAFSEKKIEVNLFDVPTNLRKILIIPEVNVFNENNFKTTEAKIEKGIEQ